MCLLQSMEHGVLGPTGLRVAVHVDQGYLRDSAPVLILDQLLMGRTAMVSQLNYGCVKQRHVQVRKQKSCLALCDLFDLRSLSKIANTVCNPVCCLYFTT